MRTLDFVPFFFAGALFAQEAALEWQKRSTAIHYNPVPVGKHGLDELKVGEAWRLGMNEASTWKIAMPILANDAWIAPGHYRVQLQRRSEDECAVLANGSSLAFGAGGSGDGQVVGKIGKLAKPASKLAIDITKKGNAVGNNQPAQITVQFGDTEWQGPMTVVGNKTMNVSGAKLTVFAIPAEQMEKGPVPIATWSRGKDGDENWNVVLDKSTVRLVPWMKAPTESYGFGAVIPPDATQQTEGTASPVEAKADKELAALEVREATSSKGELRLVVAFGKQTLDCRIPEPKQKK